MRNDHTSYPLDGHQPTPAELERLLRGARRMRSEAVHAYLKRAVDWVRWLFSRDSVRIKVTVRARRVTC
jgi:hypothetical protein